MGVWDETLSRYKTSEISENVWGSKTKPPAATELVKLVKRYGGLDSGAKTSDVTELMKLIKIYGGLGVKPLAATEKMREKFTNCNLMNKNYCRKTTRKFNEFIKNFTKENINKIFTNR